MNSSKLLLCACGIVALALPAGAQGAFRLGSGNGMDKYITSVRQQMGKQWMSPAQAEYKLATDKPKIDLAKLDPELAAICEHFAKVSVTIARDGTVSSCKLTDSCGDSKFDTEALTAVRSVGKFNPLPKSAPNTVTLELGFEPAPLQVSGNRNTAE